MKNETTVLTMVQGLSPLDWVRIGTPALGILVCIFAGRRTFVLAEAIAIIFHCCMALLFPAQLTHFYVDGKLDAMHWYFWQLMLAIQMGLAVRNVLNRNAKSESVHTARQLCGLLIYSGTVILGVNYYSVQAKAPLKLSTMYMTAGLSSNVLFCFGNFYHLWKSPTLWSYSTARNSWLNKLLLLDVLLSLLFTIGPLTTPEVGLKQLTFPGSTQDVLHAFQARYIYLLILAGELYGLFATQFSLDSDKKAYFWSKLLSMGPCIGMLIYQQWKYSILDQTIFYAACAIQLFMFSFSICGVCQRKAKHN